MLSVLRGLITNGYNPNIIRMIHACLRSFRKYRLRADEYSIFATLFQMFCVKMVSYPFLQ